MTNKTAAVTGLVSLADARGRIRTLPTLKPRHDVPKQDNVDPMVGRWGRVAAGDDTDTVQ